MRGYIPKRGDTFRWHSERFGSGKIDHVANGEVCYRLNGYKTEPLEDFIPCVGYYKRDGEPVHICEHLLDKWDQRFMDVAWGISSWSKDQSTKVGCVLVRDRRIIATGYNGAPRGVDEEPEERNERPEKYYWYEHGERNAIYNCAREGVKTEGSKAYVLPLLPCHACARALVQSGIEEVFAGVDSRGVDRCTDETHERAIQIFNEARVPITIVHLGKRD